MHSARGCRGRPGAISASFFVVFSLFQHTCSFSFFKRLEKNGTKPQGVLLPVAVHPHPVCYNLIRSGRFQYTDRTHGRGCSLAPPVVQLGGDADVFFRLSVFLGQATLEGSSLLVIAEGRHSSIGDWFLVANTSLRGWPWAEPPW